MNTSITIRPRATAVSGTVITLMCAIAVLVDVVLIAQGTLEPWVLVLPLGLGVVCWLMLVTPRLIVSDDSVKVRNPFVAHTVPYERIEDLSTRFGLELFLDDGSTVHAWGAPPPNTVQRVFTKSGSDKGMPSTLKGLPMRPSDTLGSASGDAFVLIHRQLERERHGSARKVTQLCWVDLALVAVTLCVSAAVVLH